MLIMVKIYVFSIYLYQITIKIIKYIYLEREFS